MGSCIQKEADVEMLSDVVVRLCFCGLKIITSSLSIHEVCTTKILRITSHTSLGFPVYIEILFTI